MSVHACDTEAVAFDTWVWCLTCHHIHIPTIPTMTYQCSDCGFGVWDLLIAEHHATEFTTHIVHPSFHRIVEGDHESHRLVVTEWMGELEYNLEHPGCLGRYAYMPGMDRTVVEFDCAVGFMVLEEGLMGTVAPDGLAVGTYEVTCHTSHYPSTPNGPEEWDAWVEVEPIR